MTDIPNERLAYLLAWHDRRDHATQSMGPGTITNGEVVALIRRVIAVGECSCSGCGSRPIACAKAVIEGRVACCPDCSTFTAAERNELRKVAKVGIPMILCGFDGCARELGHEGSHGPF
jgi:hypothetical protein